MESTKGIVLHYYKYSESSVIAKIFTEESGLQPYVLKGVRNKKSKNKVNLLQALNLVNMEASNISKRNIQYIKEIRSEIALIELMGNINKRFMSMFIAEILLKVLIESEEDKNLFNYIENMILSINKKGELNKNFSLIFLLKLSKYLGFPPSTINSEKEVFDLENSCFTNQSSYYSISGENKNYFVSLLKGEEGDIPYKNRKELLQSLQKYYKLHHYNIDKLRSYEVIESLRI